MDIKIQGDSFLLQENSHLSSTYVETILKNCEKCYT